MGVELYKNMMLASAIAIIGLGAMLMGIRIPVEKGLEKLRRARNILLPSYFVMGILSLLCYFTGYDRNFEPASTLFVASFQALLFTMAMLVFIRPKEVQWKVMLWQAVGITLTGICLFVALFLMPDIYQWVFYIALIAYLAQLVAYTWIFRKAYQRTVQEVEDYYEEDEESRLRWICFGFYSALAVGFMALFVLFIPDCYVIFVPLYIIYYAFVVSRFGNYWQKMNFAIPVISSVSLPDEAEIKEEDINAIISETGDIVIQEINDEVADSNDEKEKEKTVVPLSEKELCLKDRLQKFIDDKEYCRKDVPSDDSLHYFGVDKSFLRRYMKDYYGMDFRPWRKELRIREASRLFTEQPKYTIEEVCEMVGYNNRSNFNRDFKQLMGVTPKCYCKQVCVKNTVAQEKTIVNFNKNSRGGVKY